jgi:HEAT repeat protein
MVGQTGTTRKIILSALEDENVQTRRVAARTVAEIIDDPPLKSAMKALKDTDADVRNYAAQIVGKIRSAEAVQPLIKMLLEDENDKVKASVADSLGKIGKPAVKPLIELLEGTKDLELSLRLVRILGITGDKRAVKPLEKIYKETPNTVLKDATAKALNEIP